MGKHTKYNMPSNAKPSVEEYLRRDSRFYKKHKKDTNTRDLVILFVTIALLAGFVHFYVNPLTEKAHVQAPAPIHQNEYYCKILLQGNAVSTVQAVDYCRKLSVKK